MISFGPTEEQSVAQVAAALDLSPDAVKQRLSRGRGLLREQVARLVEGALRRSRPGRPFTVVGDGTQTRDFIYVTDVAASFLEAAETKIVGERFNVGAGKPQSINRLVTILGGEVVYVPKRPGEPDCTFANINKIKTQLGWSPKVDFEDGVKNMLKEIKRWQDAPLWDPASIARATETWFRYLGRESVH